MVSFPSVSLSSEEIDRHFRTMRKGNTALKRCAELTGLENKTFRSKLFHSKFNPDETDVKGERIWPAMADTTIAEIIKSIPLIEAVRSIEWTMLCAYSRLAKRHAKAWTKLRSGVIVSEADYFQEAIVALLDAIYSYTQDNVKFITFAWRVIYNRLAAASNKNNPFGPMTNEALKLLKRFEEAKFTFNGPVTDDEVMDSLNLTEEETALLKDVQVRVYGAPEVCSKMFPCDGERTDDYTATRYGIDNEKDTVPCNFEIREAMQHANLTDFERQIVSTSLYPHYGWQTELAAAHVNPNTNKPYSRAAIAVMLERALRKIKAVYLDKVA